MIALDDELKRGLLWRARMAIARAIGANAGAGRRRDEPGHRHGFDDGGPAPRVLPFGPAGIKAGAFVSIHLRGQLRGCIGYPEPELPLIAVIDHCAVSAAISDPRFPALSIDEWDDIDIEISVLGPIETVTDIADVVVGQHGLIVEEGRRRGLLLPQVASERNWTAAEFASETCIKAGLGRDAWQNGATLFRFQAEVFGERGFSSPKSEI
jgi:AmmeMemoRadiSam system protein A